jgi:acetyltransferase EpsM
VSEPGFDLYVMGAGGHARELHAYLADLSRAGWKGTLKGFLDDSLTPGVYGRIEALGPIAAETLPGITAGSRYITALGVNPVRRRVVERVTEIFGPCLTPWSLIHPAAWMGEDVEVGEGTCLAPGAIVTANTRVGRHCILNIKSSVSHDCVIGDFVNINPAATVCGWVNIGNEAYIGAGATVKDRVSIGAGAIIGAGAVVTRDIPPNVTAVGVPARVIKSHS